MGFPFVVVAGSPFQIGSEYGRHSAIQIQAFIDYLVATSGETRKRVVEAAARFRPLFEQYCPEQLEAVKGLAEGAGISVDEALLPQVRGEVLPLLAEGCTTFAVDGRHTESGQPLIGQTSDMEPELLPYLLVLQVEPDDGPRFLTWTFAGQLGYHGLNEHGVAQFANALGGGPVVRMRPGGLPHYPIKRRLYECRTREEVLATWNSMPVCSSGNYMLSVGGELFDLEVTPDGCALLRDEGEGLLVHTNHFLSEGYRTPETDAAAWPDSFPRLNRMQALLREHAGSIRVETMKELLGDHHGHPAGICRHQETAERTISTVGALIAEPATGRLHISYGSPCRREWTTYTLSTAC